ncbi:hypothetical protein [uncultured Selenomonas sp.]|uniref:hypothetical protein n=1 Tax=uncultured Selenomonas sp. TaxID=159275 RepID=UPI0025DE278A|nr:hypothetical protein [uncultured Selenomonas sp.]
MASSREAARRRARNQVWTAAGAYGFAPGFLAFFRDGTPDAYLNAIVGFVHRFYDAKKIMAWLDGLHESVFSDTLTDVAWLGMESAVFPNALEVAPALAGMQREHAKRFLVDLKDVDISMQERMVNASVVQTLKAARCREVLGQDAGLRNPWDHGLYEALKLPPVRTTEELTAELDDVLHRYFRMRMLVGHRRAWHIALPEAMLAALRRVLPVQLVQDDAPTRQGGRGTDEGVMGASGTAAFLGRKHAGDWRRGLALFGAPYFSETRRAEIEADVCVGSHAGAHVYFARAEGAGNETNLAWAEEHAVVLRQAQRELAARLKNVVDVTRQPLAVAAKRGRLHASRAWRVAALQDARVFQSVEEELYASFDVTLLLDASASRESQQARIAAEARLVAESLQAATIPVQCWSFASVRGVTVLTSLKSFEERTTRRIAAYIARGWNRDGLALRALSYLLERGGRSFVAASKRHVVLMLTDAHPGDDLGLARADGLLERSYMGRAAVDDAAESARALRKSGVQIIGLVESVFPGEETDGAAQTIFGTQFVRVRAVEELAKKAGTVLERELAAR